MPKRDWVRDIRAFRQENNLTQHDLATFLGVSQKSVSRWERGADLPAPEIRKRLALLLSDGPAARLPDLFEAVRDAAVPLALIDGNGNILMASRTFSPQGGKSMAPAGAMPPTVLVVEDDEAVLKATRAVLKRWNFLSVSAADGEEAVRMVADGSVAPQGAIIDFRLPGALDGVDLALHLRESRPTLPILIISGEASAEQMVKISQSGLPFIAKPVDPDEIRMALLSLLPQTG